MNNISDIVDKIKNIKKLSPIYLVLVGIMIYTVFFSYYTIMEHYTYQTHAYDLGIFLQSFWTTINEGKMFYTTLWEGSRFENHFAPILFVLLPIYALFPMAETFLIIQSFILALGALPLYWIAKKELGIKAGIIFSFLYLIYPALQGINRYDFHEVAFAPTFILFTFYFFKEKNYKLTMIFAILSLFSREDVAMVVVPMALLWLYEKQDRSFKDKETILLCSIIVGGTIWFLLTTQVIIPYFSVNGYYYVKQYSYTYLTMDISKKIKYFVDIFLPLLFIPIFNRTILITIPIFLRNYFSNKSSRYLVNNQHPALIVPFVFLSAIYAIKSISPHIDGAMKAFLSKLAYPSVMLMVIISLFSSPILKAGFPMITEHDIALDSVISLIPENASVYTQNNIFPHIASRSNAYYALGDNGLFYGWSTTDKDFRPWKNASFEYILMDDNQTSSEYKWSILRRADDESIDIIMRDYGLYAAIDRIFLFKKGYNGTVNVVFEDFFDNGLYASYYNDENLGLRNNFSINNSRSPNSSNYSLENFEEINLENMSYPVFLDRVGNVNFNWGKNSPIRRFVNEEKFSVKFEGYLSIPENGSYLFQIKRDGKSGARLYIDDMPIIDSWTETSTNNINRYQRLYLYQGSHKIRIDYKDITGNSFVRLYWSTPWKARFEIIPELYFYLPREDLNNTVRNYGLIINTTGNNTELNGYSMSFIE